MNVIDMLNTPWVITPEKLTEMCAIYASHRNGEAKDLKAVEAALGRPLQPGGAKSYEVQDGIATIPLEGVLSKRMGLFSQISGGQSYQSFVSELQQAGNDPDVMGIIITVDSPGGAVDGTQQAADAVYAMRSVKPICTLVNGEMCSAAYWIGSSASRSYISSDTDVVGSIGVVTQHVDTSAAEYQRGIKVTDIAAGKYKRITSQHAPLSPEGRGAIQDQLDHVYGVFVDAVARNRGVDADTVVNKMADGRVFRGQQAIDAGLVDGKMTLPALLAQMAGQKGRAASKVAVSKGSGSVQSSTFRSGDLSAPVLTSVPTAVSTATPPVQAAPKANPAPSEAEIRLEKLQVLTSEETSARRLLKDAEASLKTAETALAQASRTPRPTVETLLPYTTAVSRAQMTIRDLQSRLQQNDAAQREVLRGNVARQPATSVAKSTKTDDDPTRLASEAQDLIRKARNEGQNLGAAQAVSQLSGDVDAPTRLAMKARDLVKKATSEGRRLSFAQAVSQLSREN